MMIATSAFQSAQTKIKDSHGSSIAFLQVLEFRDAGFEIYRRQRGTQNEPAAREGACG